MNKSKIRNNLYLVGAGSHARSLLNLAELSGLKIAGIYENSFAAGEQVNHCDIIGTFSDIKKDDILILAVGNNIKREDIFTEYRTQIYEEGLIHPSAVLEPRVTMGCSNQVFAGVYLNSNVKTGDNNIINTKSVLEHEVVIGNHNHISVGAMICGRTKIGNRCFIGAGAIVIDKLSICNDVVIGAGSVVTKNINSPGTYVGNPARKIK